MFEINSVHGQIVTERIQLRTLRTNDELILWMDWTRPSLIRTLRDYAPTGVLLVNIFPEEIHVVRKIKGKSMLPVELEPWLVPNQA